MDKKKNIFSRMLSSFTSMFAGLFSPKARKSMNGLSVLEEEAITSPTKVVWKNFINDKLARIGLIGFVAILCFSFIGSIMFPMDALNTEAVIKNVQPGKGYLSVSDQLVKEGVKDIRSGITFSIGLSNEGNLYGWGIDQEGSLNIPDDVKSRKIEKISIGDKHVLALSDTGKLYAWGYNNFNQGEVPVEMKGLFEMEKIQDIFAGEQYSAVLTKKGNLYIWGSVLSSKLDIIPEDYQGRIVDMKGSSYNMLLLLDDGTVGTLGVAGNDFSAVPEELKDGSVKATQIAISFRNGLVLDDQGKLHVWGSRDKHCLEMPEIDEKIVEIQSGKNSFYALGESGTVYTWGTNDLGEQNVPSNLKATAIYGDYFQVYALQENGKVATWGNDGYTLGTDEQGRDLLTRLIHGGKVTLIVGFIACLIQGVIGIIVGMVSGFKGGWVDNLMMRLTEIISSIPFMPLVITLSAFLSTDMTSDQKMYLIMFILGCISWPGLARLIRGQILIEREKDFVLAARALGIKEAGIMVRHILPNVLNICIVNITLSYASNMLTESALSFLGFGVQPPMPSWGNMLTNAQKMTVIELYWWQWILPALCIFIAAFSINLIGDGLRAALDPKANEK